MNGLLITSLSIAQGVDMGTTVVKQFVLIMMVRTEEKFIAYVADRYGYQKI